MRPYCRLAAISTAIVLLLVEAPASTAAEPSHPHLQALFTHLSTRQPTAAPAGVTQLTGAPQAIALTREDVTALLNAAASDNLTLLRAVALFARWVNARNVPVFAAGLVVQQGVQAGFSLGLTFPVDHIAYMCFAPDSSIGGDFQSYIRVMYTRLYDYPFDRDIFNADVLVRGRPTLYQSEQERQTGYLITTEVHYNDSAVMYTKVEGIQGQKRGMTGLLQKMFFFIPKTLNGLILTDGDLIIDAFVNDRIRSFEQKPRYRVIRR